MSHLLFQSIDFTRGVLFLKKLSSSDAYTARSVQRVVGGEGEGRGTDRQNKTKIFRGRDLTEVVELKTLEELDQGHGIEKLGRDKGALALGGTTGDDDDAVGEGGGGEASSRRVDGRAEAAAGPSALGRVVDLDGVDQVGSVGTEAASDGQDLTSEEEDGGKLVAGVGELASDLAEVGVVVELAREEGHAGAEAARDEDVARGKEDGDVAVVGGRECVGRDDPGAVDEVGAELARADVERVVADASDDEDAVVGEKGGGVVGAGKLEVADGVPGAGGGVDAELLDRGEVADGGIEAANHEHIAAGEADRGVVGAGNLHVVIGRGRPAVGHGVKEFGRGKGGAVVAQTAGNKHAAGTVVDQDGGVVASGKRERARGRPDVAVGVVDLGSLEAVAIVIVAADDKNVAVEKRRRRVARAGTLEIRALSPLGLCSKHGRGKGGDQERSLHFCSR